MNQTPFIDLAAILEPLLQPLREENAQLRAEVAEIKAEQKAAASAHSSALLSEKEACALLHISRTHLWRLRQEGKIDYIVFGGTFRYRRADLEAYIASHTVSARKLRRVS